MGSIRASDASLCWVRDGADWPNRDFSLFADADDINFHVQIMGQGPVLLLLHGTAASTHSFRDVAPLLAQDFTVVLPDLPGHGFSSAPPASRMALAPMAHAVGHLLRKLGISPALAAGHSAGAAIAARMALDGYIAPQKLFSLNGALLPLPGGLGAFYGSVAKMMAMTPVMPWLLALQAENEAMFSRMLENTGSRLDARGIGLYRQLLRNPVQMANVMAMAANWRLEQLAADLPVLQPKLMMIVGEGDRAVSPKVAEKVARMVPGSRVFRQLGLGHLSHEEDPTATADLIKMLA
jgi:magnesium chelatase accessory protein